MLEGFVRSGLFLTGARRIGKSKFPAGELVPALSSRGAVVVYVDRWSAPNSPAAQVCKAIAAALEQLTVAGNPLLRRNLSSRKLSLEVPARKLGFALETLGQRSGATLAEAMTQLVDQTKTDMVLMDDEVRHALTSEASTALLYSLKAARDAVNLRPHTPGYFLFLGTGSHQVKVRELVQGQSQAFLASQTLDFPLQGPGFVDFVLEQVRGTLKHALPSKETAFAAFQALGHRPEELVRALALLKNLPQGHDPDTAMTATAVALRSSMAERELARPTGMGALHQAVFARLARGLPAPSSKAAKEAYAGEVGHAPNTGEVQTALNGLVGAGYVVRAAGGTTSAQIRWCSNSCSAVSSCGCRHQTAAGHAPGLS
jgi:hypothetical protein